jgi:hypothetical protein
MIAGPYCNVPLASVIDPLGIIVPGTLYEFNGGYVNATSINSAKGYWIKANAAGTITINCTTTLAKNGRELALPSGITDSFTKIEISDNADGHQTLFFNARLQSTVNIESFSLPPAAPAGTFDARFEGDYRLSEASEVNIHFQAVSYPVNIKVTNLKPEEGYIYVMKEMVGGQIVGEHNLSEGASVLLKNKDVTTLIIYSKKDIPSSFELVQNYPNPFNPSTLIQYNIPEARDVSMIIYNSLGEKIKTLVSGVMEAGFYNVVWDGTNDYGANVGSGTYIYAIRAGDFYSAKKMVLVK